MVDAASSFGEWPESRLVVMGNRGDDVWSSMSCDLPGIQFIRERWFNWITDGFGIRSIGSGFCEGIAPDGLGVSEMRHGPCRSASGLSHGNRQRRKSCPSWKRSDAGQCIPCWR